MLVDIPDASLLDNSAIGESRVPTDSMGCKGSNINALPDADETGAMFVEVARRFILGMWCVDLGFFRLLSVIKKHYEYI